MNAREIKEDDDMDVESEAVSGVREVRGGEVKLREETILTKKTISKVVDVLHRACRH